MDISFRFFKENAPRPKNRAGFTLIEVLVVLAIIGIVSMIAIPGYLSWMPGIRLKTAARELYANLQKAKLRAIKEGRPIRVRFNNGAGFYYFDLDNNNAQDTGELRINLADYADVAFGSGNATQNWNGTATTQATVITFNANGTANSGSVYITNLNNPAECYAVTSQISGSLKLRRYPGTTPFNRNNWD